MENIDTDYKQRTLKSRLNINTTTWRSSYNIIHVNEIQKLQPIRAAKLIRDCIGFALLRYVIGSKKNNGDSFLTYHRLKLTDDSLTLVKKSRLFLNQSQFNVSHNSLAQGFPRLVSATLFHFTSKSFLFQVILTHCFIV